MFKYILIALMLVAPTAWAADALQLTGPAPFIIFDKTDRVNVNTVNSAPIAGGVEPRLLSTASPITATGKYFIISSRQQSTTMFKAIPDPKAWSGAKGGVEVWAEDSDGKRISGSTCSTVGGLKIGPLVGLKFNLGSSQTFTNTSCADDIEWQFTSAGTGGSGKVVVQVSGNLASDMQLVITSVTNSGVTTPGLATANRSISKFSGNGNVRFEVPFTIADNVEQLYDWSLGGTVSTTEGEF